MVAKLGGILGECNQCNGDGKIKLSDKPVIVVDTSALDESVASIIDAVESVNVEPVFKSLDKTVVSDLKRKVFKRAKA